LSFKWYLQYYLGVKEPTNEFLVFGSSLHETIETILKDKSKNSSINQILREKVKKNSNAVMLNSFFGKTMTRDGIKILEELNFYKRFKGIDIVGIEDDIYLPLMEIDSVQIYFKGFIDFLGQYQKNDRVIVLDWKTAIKEWNLDKKVGTVSFDKLYPRLSKNQELTREEYESYRAKIFFVQTALYQHFVSVKYDINIEDIDIEYCTLVRQPASVKEYRVNITPEFRNWALEDVKKVANEIFTFKNEITLPKVKIEKKLKKYCDYCYFKKNNCCDDSCSQKITKEEVLKKVENEK
jgi:hypothetical protein